MKPNLPLCLRAWADEAFQATAPQSYLLHEAADALEAASAKPKPFTAADWTLDTCPPFTEPAPSSPAAERAEHEKGGAA